ncbi:MFS transporter [Hamadaea tsunoensis]|uniref:MFS transporter n=1 Tax=Hamadaea tsunoensis TaxID=53368 RepID=UPI00041ECEB2|nr:MFS transporter [Hamadaea tsunoensis]
MTEHRNESGLPIAVVLFMAVAAALGTSTIYLLQPSVADVAASTHTRVALVGIAFAAGPVGYMLGLLALVPLVDRWPPARVLAGQFAVLALALAAAAAARHVIPLAVLTALIGACSVVGAGMSSMAGRLAPAHRRATSLGIVTAGISAGILAGRIVGGWLADQLGWRTMLLVFAAACGVLAACCLAVLPTAHGQVTGGYLAGLRTLPGLFARYRALRLAAFRGALWFFGFCAVWAGLAVALSQPPYSYPAERIGLYALAGLSGIAATQIAGVWTDRVGARKVILAGLALAGTAALLSGFVLHNTVATLVCLAVFDAGLFAAQVANQSTVLALNPAAPARLNSAYMVAYFVGGSLGTMFGAAAVAWFGWAATTSITAAAIVVAAVVTVTIRPTRPVSPRLSAVEGGRSLLTEDVS